MIVSASSRRQIGRGVQRGGVGLAQVPQQALLGDALGDPAQAALLHPAEERLRLFDRLLVPRVLGFLQLLVEPRAHPREEAPPFNRLVCLVLLRGLVVALVTIGADGNQVTQSI